MFKNELIIKFTVLFSHKNYIKIVLFTCCLNNGISTGSVFGLLELGLNVIVCSLYIEWKTLVAATSVRLVKPASRCATKQ